MAGHRNQDSSAWGAVKEIMPILPIFKSPTLPALSFLAQP